MALYPFMLEAVTELYTRSKRVVVASGYGDEMEWIRTVDLSDCTESDLLREHAWVVLGSGMKEVVVASIFPEISRAFCDWRSAKCIAQSSKECKRQALDHFGHAGKIDAIAVFASRLAEMGAAAFKCRLGAEGPEFLLTFPYLGRATSFHFAKNLSLDVAKPDRHVARLAEAFGVGVQELCGDVAATSGDLVRVVDLVFWRYAVLSPHYLLEARGVADGIPSTDWTGDRGFV